MMWFSYILMFDSRGTHEGLDEVGQTGRVDTINVEDQGGGRISP